MDDDLYVLFARHLATIVQGNLPKFWTLVVVHDDGAGCGVYPSMHAAIEAGQTIIQSWADMDSTSYPQSLLDELKTQLDEKGWVHVDDIANSKLYVVEGRLTQMENAPSNL